MNDRGKTGCGCLVMVLVIIMVIAGLSFHPLSLKSFAKFLRYEDIVTTADAVFVPRFGEDTKDELYRDAFREYFAGNGRIIYIQNDIRHGKDISRILGEMARERGVKENIVRIIDAGNADDILQAVIKGKLKAAGLKKIVVVVPEYASRRYHMIYSRETAGILYMIKPLKVSYFQNERWWRDDLSRGIVAREVYNLALYSYALFASKETGK